MKIILTGSTGMVGQEILRHCLQHPAITTINVLTRRELPPSTPTSPKLNVIIHKDFGSYPDSVLKQLSGSQACIW